MALKIAVIGAGPGGYAAAVRCAQLGGDVTLIETHRIGGTCLNRGCIPSKVMKTTADLLNAFRRADEYGIRLEASPCPDIPGLMKRKKSVIETQAAGMHNLLKRNKIKFAQGRATLAGPGQIHVRPAEGAGYDLVWDRLIIAAGTSPRPLPCIPFDGHRVLSSDHILDIDAVPGSVIIVGGGVIGCEFAFILSSLGTAVTIVEELPGILKIPGVDTDTAKIIQRELNKRKIPVRLGRRAEKITVENELVLAGISPAPLPGSQPEIPPEIITAEKLLVCIGRVPAGAGLGLETLGIQTDAQGWIVTNDHMATNIEGVFAIGDLLGPSKIMLAHAAAAEGIVAAENAMGNPKKMRYDTVPSAIYTMPEVGCVGLTEAQARETGKDIRVDRFLFRQLGKAHVIGHIAGEVKMISEKTTGAVLGVHIAGPHATDLIAEATLAINNSCAVGDIARTIHAHPTLSEAIMETALAALYS